MSDFSINSIFSVSGQKVLVTGGGSGIGKTLATAFAANGATVYILGRREEVLKQAVRDIPGDVHYVVGDVSVKSGVQAVIEKLETMTPVLDTLINCAGISIPWKNPSNKHEDPEEVYKMMSEVDDDDWTRTNSININGPYFMTTLAVPLLRKSTNPNVVIISSVAGLANQRANGSFTYGVSKAGAVHLSSMLAGRLHPMKIRVNCICPGIFPSEMTTLRDEKGELILGTMGSKAVQRCTMRRPGRPQEIAAPILLLASQGGMYMNDTCINVDGGRWMVMKGIYDGIRLPEDSYVD